MSVTVNNKLIKKEFQYVLKKLKEQPHIDSIHQSQAKNQETQDTIKNLIKASCSSNHHIRLLNEFFSLGPIEELVKDTSISEIIINGKLHILYEVQGQLMQLTDSFLSDLTFNNFIHRICEESNIVLSLNQLFADGHWRGWRVHISRMPVVHVSYHISLRRHPKNPWTFSKLVQEGWATEKTTVLIQKLIDQKSNILICGPTSSGKTSVLNACLQSLMPSERVITIEDNNELTLPNAFSSKLLTRNLSSSYLTSVDQSELVKQSLRMRPDRIIMGETRGGEAKDLLMILATGHQGSLGTIHAANHKQAIWRLEMLVQMGNPSWSTHTIRQMIALSINHLILLGRKKDPIKPNHYKRILKGIYQLSGIENTGFLFETLFILDGSYT